MRRLFKLISWDYETNTGSATDGSKFNGEPFLFTVPGHLLPAHYNGFLNLEEVFSAQENQHHQLFDVIIERGPRAEAPSVSEPDRIGVLPDDKYVPEYPVEDPNWGTKRIIELEARVRTIEVFLGSSLNVELSKSRDIAEMSTGGGTGEPK